MVRHGGGDEAEQSLGWREQLATRVASVFCVLYVVAAPLVFVTMENREGRLTMVALSLVCAAFAGVPVWLGRPRGALRAWLIVGPAVLAALMGYARVGFLSGPGVFLTLTITTGGLLLGKKGLFALCTFAFTGLAFVAHGVWSGALAAPPSVDVAMTSPRAWIRTLSITGFAIFVFGMLIIDIVTRMEESLRIARAETLLRQQAERAKADAEIAALEAKQLETIGRLAAGIAHDFNNALTAIIGSAELLREDFPADAPGRDLLDAIVTSSERSAVLTRQLLAYSRKAQMILKPLDLHALIEGTVTLLRASFPMNVDVKVELSADHPTVQADAPLLQNAIVNLLVNARDAMPDGGCLTVSTASIDVGDDRSAFGQSLAPGRHVMLEVRDTGTGIESGTLPKIFEPFFTTKAVGAGSGLGLAAVAGTIRALGGAIAVESEVGRGTAFRVMLPQVDTSVGDASEPRLQLVRGRGRILLVDDDTVVRNAAERTIGSLGYDVTPASDGERALELVRNAPTPFDLVVLDLRMPKLSGHATFERLRQIAPMLPVLLWSGYGEEHDVNQLLNEGAAGFIHKPYATAELSRLLKRLTTKHCEPSDTVAASDSN